MLPPCLILTGAEAKKKTTLRAPKRKEKKTNSTKSYVCGRQISCTPGTTRFPGFPAATPLHAKSPRGQDHKRLEKPLPVPYLLHPWLLSLLHTLGCQGPCDSNSCAISTHSYHWGRFKSFLNLSFFTFPVCFFTFELLWMTHMQR